MKLLLFADLHLDRTFAWASADVGSRRRQALRDTLQRIVALADELAVDALLCAGDLYEHETVRPDTMRFLESAFGATNRRVVLAPGNHDWLSNASVYRRARWSANVEVVESETLSPLELAAGFTLWSGAFTNTTHVRGFLEGFAVDRDGTHVGLFHGAERQGLPFQERGKVLHAAFDADEIERCGLHHACVGHYHVPAAHARYTYPGNPDPLTFGEHGTRGAVLLRFERDALVERTWHVVSTSTVHDVELDVTGRASFQEILEAVRETLRPLAGCVRLRLTGELGIDVELDLGALRRAGEHLEALVVPEPRLPVAHVLEELRREGGVRRTFLELVLAAPDLDEEERRRILTTGLRAFDDREDLEVI